MPIGKPTKTPFSTLKHDEHSHGVPGGSRLDFDIFELAQMCLQVVQPPTHFCQLVRNNFRSAYLETSIFAAPS